MSTPPPRKRVSQACQPCGLKKIKVRTYIPAPTNSVKVANISVSAMGHIQCVARVRVRALNAHMEYPSEGQSPDPLRCSVSRYLEICWTGG
jgi:hypothetical protein